MAKHIGSAVLVLALTTSVALSQGQTDSGGAPPDPLFPVTPWTEQLQQPIPLAPAAPSTIPLTTNVWTALGPGPLSAGISFAGRTVGIAPDPTSASTIWIAAAGGGVWQTSNGGTTWIAKTDSQAVLFMGAIAISKLNPLVIYAGTGEANYSADSFYGKGILVSTDGGGTWSLKTGPSGIFSTNRMCTSKIVVDPTVANGSVAYAAMSSFCETGTFGSGAGIYKTTDTGATWTNVTTGITAGPFSTPFTDIVIDPTSTSNLYTTIGYPFGGALNAIYRSTDSGATWSKLTGTNAPTGATTGRFALALSSDGAHLYAVVANTTTFALLKLVRSDNPTASPASSVTFTDLTGTLPGNPFSGQGWYDIGLIVDPSDATKVYLAGSAGTNSVLKGTTSGTVWTDIHGVRSGTVAPHADHHALAFDANGKLLDGDDGGVFRYDPVADAWTDLNGTLNTIQFTGVGTHPTNPNAATGGSQDNGTEIFSGSLTWTETDGGDGGFAKFNPTTPTVLYHQIPTGSFGVNFFRVSTDSGAIWTTRTTSISADVSVQNFYAPLAVDPTSGDHVLYGTNGVWETTNEGMTWTKIGVSGTAGFASAGALLDTVAIAASDPTLTLAAATGGTFASSSKIFFTANHGGTWTEHDLPAGAGRVQELQFDPSTKTTAYAVTNTFGTSGHNVWQTIDSGVTWTNISGNLPSIPVWSLQVGATSSTLYVGTDTGVYFTTNGGTTWATLGTGFPNAQAVQLEYNPNLFILAAGTHGRGMWEILTQNATVTNVTSSIADGTYGAAASIPIQVTFNEKITVTGTPQLALNSGGTANYTSGSGTNTLTFTYTVAGGESSADLDYTSTSALTLNGGTILDPSANAAVLTLAAPGAAGSLGFNKNIVIGTLPAPTLVSPANGAIAVPVSTSLTWNSSTGATSYDVYLGTSNPPPLVTNVATTNYTPGALTASTQYFWKIVAKNASTSTASAIWSFTTLKPGAQPVSVSPSSGSSGRQVFTFLARDAAGVSSILYTQFLFSKSGLSAVNACYISYDPVGNVFYLLSDDTTQWYGLLGGSANTTGNAQCTIYGATSGSTKVGTDLTTHVDISFRSGFSGLKTISQFSGDTLGMGSGWQSMGTWNDTGDPSAVELISMSPNSGTGLSQLFTAVIRDGDGATTIPFAELVMTAQPVGSFSGNGCFIFYAQASNVFFLLNDSATAFSGIVGGSAGSVSNSQCTLNGVGSGGTHLPMGSDLTVTYNLTFAPGFAGTKQIYMQAADNTGIIEVWHLIATWNP